MGRLTAGLQGSGALSKSVVFCFIGDCASAAGKAGIVTIACKTVDGQGPLALLLREAMLWFESTRRRRLGRITAGSRCRGFLTLTQSSAEEGADRMAGVPDITLDSPVRFGATGARVRITCRNSLLQPISVHFPSRAATIRARLNSHAKCDTGMVWSCDLAVQPIG